MVGMSRPAALEFSFFVSMPTMAAATLYTLYRTLHPKGTTGITALGAMPSNGHEWMVLIIGFVVSFLVGLGVLSWFWNWVRHRGLVPFALYRIILGITFLL